MAFALSELFVNITARTAGFDRAVAGTQAKASALSNALGHARDANGRFIAGMGGGAATISRSAGAFGGLTAGLSRIGSGFAAASTAVGTFAGNIASRLAMMAAPIAGDILGGEAIAMEDRLAGLAKAADLAGPSLQSMKMGLFDMSTTLKGIRLDDLLDIATIGAKMGIAEGDLLRYTEGIAKVSVALDDMPAAEIAEQIGKINNVWKLGVEGAFQLGSAVDALADSGASSAEGIFNVMQRVGKSTKGLGMSAAETLGLATAITDTGTRSEQAATSLIQLTNALVDTESHATFGKVLGVSAEDFAASVRANPMEALKTFLSALQKLDAGSQNLALKGIGIEGAQNPTEIKGLAETLDTVAKHSARAASEMGSLDQLTRSYSVNSALTSAQLAQDANRFQVMSITIGDQMLPAIKLASEAFGAFSSAITAAFAGNEASIAGFREQVIGIATAAGTGTGVFATLAAEAPAAFELAAVKIGNFLTNIGETFVWLKDTGIAIFNTLGASLASIFESVLATIRNTFAVLETALGNILSFNIGDVFKGDVDLLKGFDLANAREESDLVGNLPQLVLPPLAFSLDPRIAELEAETAGRMLAKAMGGGAVDGITAAADAKAKAASDFVGPPKPDTAKGTFADDEKKKKEGPFKSESIGLADFATKFRQGQLTGRSPVAEEAAKASKENTAAMKKLTAMLDRPSTLGLA